MRLFIYGTLRAGEDNHHMMGGHEPFARVVSDPVYSMVDLGGYPALLAEGTTSIIGELYDVDTATLARLDIFEEVPELYRRVTTVVEGHTVQLYLLPKRHAAGAPIIPSGDWCLHRGTR